jgi:hypothetical protein
MPYPRNVRGLSDPSQIRDVPDAKRYIQELQEAVVELGNSILEADSRAAVVAEPVEQLVENNDFVIGMQREITTLDSQLRQLTPHADDFPVQLRFRYDGESTVDGDPGSYYFRFNSTTIASATELYISTTTLNDLDLSGLFAAFGADGRILIQRVGDLTQSMVLTIVTTQGYASYWKVTFTVDSSALQTEWLNHGIFTFQFPLSEKGTFVDSYTVMVSASDSQPNYLDPSIKEGKGIETVIVADEPPAGNESLEINVIYQDSIVVDLLTNKLKLVNDEDEPPANQFYGYVGGEKGWHHVPPSAGDQLVKVTVADTVSSYLDAAVTEGDAILTTVLNPGGDETLQFDVRYQHSLELSGNILQFVNDEAVPAGYDCYGYILTKGWQPMGDFFDDTDTIDVTQGPGAIVTIDARYQMSITADVNGLKLVNDETTPAGYDVYGNIGAKGWHAFGDFIDDTWTIVVTQGPGAIVELDVQHQMSITSDLNGIVLLRDRRRRGKGVLQLARCAVQQPQPRRCYPARAGGGQHDNDQCQISVFCYPRCGV